MRAGSTPATRTTFGVTMISCSPNRNTFQKENYIKRCAESGKKPNEAYIKMFEQANINKMAQEQDPEWQQNNMEYDMRTSDFMLAKVRSSEAYSQNLYAAMCNRTFQKNEVWATLKNQTWSCSWRYAGGIIADMRVQGDYMDWYCSGIGGVIGGGSESSPEIEAAILARKNYVPESVVTDEIREDLFRLGWIVKDDTDHD
jgi:hypothetical protein